MAADEADNEDKGEGKRVGTSIWVEIFPLSL